MNLELSLLIITIIFFINGILTSYFLKLKLQNRHRSLPTTSPIVDYSEFIEIVEHRKQLQIDSIAKKINEMQIKLDIIEATVSHLSNISNVNIKSSNNSITEKSDFTSQNTMSRDIIQEINSNLSHPSGIYNKSVAFTSKHNATNYYILKILLKEPLTSNEIKNAIGRTREHTARLMKKLFDLELVERNETTKPFKYKLTNEGKNYIEKHLEKSDFTSSQSHSTLSDLTH